jgi:hypothetical protein
VAPCRAAWMPTIATAATTSAPNPSNQRRCIRAPSRSSPSGGARRSAAPDRHDPFNQIVIIERFEDRS